MSKPPTAADPQVLLAHAQFVQALARQILRDEHEAEDVAQETWMAALRREPDAPGLRAWLGGVVRNLSLARRRSQFHREDRERRAARADRVGSAAELVEAETLRRAVVQAVLELEEPTRSAVIARFYDGLAPREIAQRIQVPVETVRTRIKRGVGLIRAQIEAKHGARAVWGPLLARAAQLSGAEPLVAAQSVAFPIGKLAAAVGIAALAAAAIWSPWDLESPPNSQPGPAAGPTAPAGAAATSVADTKSENGARAELETQINESFVLGRVVGPTGEGIPHANIVCIPESIQTPFVLDVEPLPGGARVGVCDQDGRFRLPVESAADVYFLAAYASGMGPNISAAVRAEQEMEIRLRPAVVVTGHVRTLQGEPVVRAQLSWLVGLDCIQIRRKTTADAEGRYRVEGLPPFEAWSPKCWHRIEVTAQGLPPLRVANPQFPEGKLDLWMARGASLEGSVSDLATRNPITGAQIEVETRFGGGNAFARSHGPLIPFGRFGNPLSARSNGDGTFQLADVPAQGIASQMSLEVAVLAEGYLPWRKSLPPIAEGNRHRLEIRLKAGLRVRGRVVDQRGIPVEGATVMVGAEAPRGREVLVSGWRPQSWITDAKGEYQVLWEPPATGNATIVSMAVLVREKMLAGALELQRGTELSLPDFVFPQSAAGRDVSVEVCAEDGKPVGGAFVNFGLNPPTLAMAPRTGRDGKVRVPFSEENVPSLRLTVRAPGFAPVKTDVLSEANRTAPMKIVLKRERTLRGRVLSAAGQPAPGTQIHVLHRSAPVEQWFPGPGSGPALTDSGDTELVYLSWGQAGADGSFEIGELPPGPYIVRAVGEGDATVLDVPESTFLEVRLEGAQERPKAAGVIEVKAVERGTRRPIAVFEAWLEPGAGRGELLAPGIYQIKGVPAGDHRLRCRAPGYVAYSAESVAVTNSEVPVEWTAEMAPAVALRGTLRLRGVEKPPSGSLQFETLEGELIRGEVIDGSFEVSHLDPTRTYRVWFASALGLSGRSLYAQAGSSPRVSVSERGEESSLELWLEEAAYVSLKAPKGLSGRYTLSQNGIVLGVRTHRDGNTGWRVGAGEYQARAELGDGRVLEKSVTAKPGEFCSVEF
ncbi:MAG: sigma-70 family RNA polymerase sigma factor [Planctomycetes bacterium]|nr:sigma-70 family RNA polymerase sigma factor [Planctomycetota bacterium]